MKVRVQMRNGRVCGSASTPLKNTMNGRSVINVFTSLLSENNRLPLLLASYLVPLEYSKLVNE